MANNNVAKNKDGYGYKYTDIAQIHEWLEANGLSYYQYTDRIEADDYIYTVPVKDGKELPARRGCRVINATLNGKSNPAQEQGSALTYARRYSLLMAFGLATEDDDAQALTRKKISAQQKSAIVKELNRTGFSKSKLCEIYNSKTLDDIDEDCFDLIMDGFKTMKDKEK